MYYSILLTNVKDSLRKNTPLYVFNRHEKSVIIGIMIKKCPFNHEECNSECALFIAPKDLNEFVASRLGSVGVFDKENGMCSLKNLALGQSRIVFEKSSHNNF